MTSLTDAFDCYYCANCLNTERGVRLPASSEDWCYVSEYAYEILSKSFFILIRKSYGDRVQETNKLYHVVPQRIVDKIVIMIQV